MAFYIAESYVAAARRQQRRIQRARRTTWKPGKRSRHSLFDDVHFYLISWVRIAKLSRFVSQQTKYQQVGRVLHRYCRDLEEKVHLRNHLEHIEERLPDGKKAATMSAPNAFRYMVGDSVSYEKRLVNVGKESVDSLAEFVGELHDAVLFDSMEALLTDDRERLGVLIERAARDAHLDKVRKRVTAMLNPTHVSEK